MCPWISLRLPSGWGTGKKAPRWQFQNVLDPCESRRFRPTCTRHLAEYVKRWSKGTVETRLCALEDYETGGLQWTRWFFEDWSCRGLKTDLRLEPLMTCIRSFAVLRAFYTSKTCFLLHLWN